MGKVERWLTVAEAARKCDAIFVLAGAAERKAHGLEMYRAGLAPRIVLSVGRFEIRRLPELALPAALDLLSAAQSVPPPERHFFVAFSDGAVRYERTRVGRFGTLSEMAALSEWRAKNPEVRSLLVVSSGYHLRRVRMCCRALLAQVQCVFEAAPQEQPTPSGRLAAEVVKLAMYSVVLMFRGGRM